jgi:hypothetical protein
MKRIGSTSKATHLFVVLITLCWLGCVESPSSDDKNDQGEDISVNGDNAATGSIIKLEGEIFSIPSPVQTAILVRKSNLPYNEELLNPNSNEQKYVNRFQKALNLGVYGADLAYLSNFNNSQLKLNYFKTVEQLSSDLNIREHINQDLLDRFASNVDNPDSLHVLNAELFRSADRYLKESQENEIASLILVGGWVEGMHIAVKSATEMELFRKRVGEQQLSVSSMVNLLKNYDSPQVQQLRQKFIDLQSAYEGLSSSYTYVKPITDAAERVTYVNSKSSVEMSDEQLARITKEVESLRNFIIQ